MDGATRAMVERDPAGHRLFAALAVGGWVATVTASGLAVALRIASGSLMVDNRFQFGDASLAGMVVMHMSFASVGAIVAARKPHHLIGWLLLAAGLIYALSIAAAAYVSAQIAAGADAANTTVWAGLVADATSYLGGNLIFWAVVVFPDGRVPIRAWPRWRPVFFALWIAIGVLLLIRPGRQWLFTQLENPLAVPPSLAAVTQTTLVVLLALGVVAVAATVPLFLNRVRAARGVERQQLKWFATAGGIWVAALFVVFATGVLPGMGALGELPLVVFLVAASLMPIAIGVAILRYHLYDIDLIIRRTLSYAVLTLLLAAVYGALVLILQALLAPITQQSSVAIAASTLAVAAVFQPVRRRIQQSVDRRFYRSRYDAARTVETFSARLREPVDLERLSAELCGMVQETMRPVSVSLWLAARSEGQRSTPDSAAWAAQ